jgi:poly-gamma-glutamate synthesis protein (capsule biosynthesis protein)
MKHGKDWWNLDKHRQILPGLHLLWFHNLKKMRRLPLSSLIFAALLLLCSFFLNTFIQQTHPYTVAFAFLGDILIGRDVALRHQDSDWSSTFAAIAPTLQEADIVIGNLESPICISNFCTQKLNSHSQSVASGNNSSNINLCAQGVGVPILKATGIDILSLVNNHTSDCEVFEIVSREEFSNYWKQIMITPLTQENQPIYLMVNDISFTFFAFDDVANPINLEEARQRISRAAAKTDFVIVSMHWGHEYQASPSDRQRNIAHVLSQSGADIIWGHHPHVLQTTEWITNKNRASFVIYSSGNALFDQLEPIDTRESAVLLVTVDHDSIVKVDAVPFEINPFLGSVSIASEKISGKIIDRLDLSER